MQQSHRNEYFDILRQYVQRGEESQLARAADLGRRMLQEERPPEELAEVHEQALRRLGEAKPELTLKETAGLISTPFMEMLMAYGLYHREQQERQRLEEQIAELFHAIRHAPAVVVMTDAEGKVEFVNPYFTRLTGFETDAVMGQSPSSFLFGGISETDYREILKSAARKGTWQGEFENRDSRGEPFWIAAAVSQAGKHSRGKFVAVFEDISASKERERYLAEARKAAEEASRAKSEFLATMSHEIRTPLTVTMGGIDYLLHTNLDPEQRKFTEMARKASASLLTLINDILDFSRIEADKLELRNVPFVLRDFSADVVDILRLEAENKGLDLFLEISPEAPEIWVGDPDRIRQVLVNLIGNAIKFTEQGSVEVRAERGCSAGEERLRFTVADTGIGIPPEKQEAIFQRFTQADSSFKRKHGGAGLGLAICQKLVQRMGGVLELESREGRGSVFSFSLPPRLPSRT